MDLTKHVANFIVFFLIHACECDELSEDHKTKLSNHFVQHGINCITRHKISLEDLQALKEMRLPKDEASYCFFACVLRRSELMDASGRISADGALKFVKTVFPDDKERREVILVFLSCDHVNDVKVRNPCERAKFALTCLINSTREDGNDPNSQGRKLLRGGLERSFARVIRSLLLLGCESIIGDNLAGRFISKFVPGSGGIGFLCSFLNS